MNKCGKNDSSSRGNIEDVEQQGLEPILSHEAELTHPLASFGRSRFSFFLLKGACSVSNGETKFPQLSTRWRVGQFSLDSRN
jgi:hypothetical protein